MTNPKSNNQQWFTRAFNLEHSVIPKIIFRLGVVTCVAVVVTLAYYSRLPVALPVLGSIVPNVILGLLLVFKTNTAYDRFWEGRKLWGTITNTSKNIARVLSSNDNIEQGVKVQLVNHVYNFARLSKDKFFGEIDKSQLSEVQSKLVSPNLHELRLMQSELYQLTKNNKLTELSYIDLTSKLDILTNCIGGCERIIATPIPLAYSIHIKQLILLYCFTVPFQFVGQTGWWTPLLSFVICAALMGIEEIGLEIENPFGKDHNDIDIVKIVEGIRVGVDEGISV
jgi:ion channel-forming bestrophin family protein